MNLTIERNKDYSTSTGATSSVGFSIPFKRAQALTRRAFFVPTDLWWAAQGRLRVGRTLDGNANSAQPATLLISIIGGGLFKPQEKTTMSNYAGLLPTDAPTSRLLESPIDPSLLIESLPWLLNEVLELILLDLATEADDTETACIILMLTIDRLLGVEL